MDMLAWTTSHPYREAASRPLASGQYIAQVTYLPLTYAELKARFPGFIHEHYQWARFQLFDSCRAVPRLIENPIPTPVELRFRLVRMPSRSTTSAAIQEITGRGLRPATFEEMLCFGAAFPQFYVEPLVALGSIAINVVSYFAMLWWIYKKGAALDLRWMSEGWEKRCRFLAVEEPR